MELGISMFGDLHTGKDGVSYPASKRLPEIIEEIKNTLNNMVMLLEIKTMLFLTIIM